MDDLKIASRVWATQISHDLGSRFVIGASASAGHTPGELVQAIDQVLSGLRAKAPSGSQQRAAIVGYLIDRVFGLEQSIRRADLFANCEEEEGRTQPCVDWWLNRYARIDPAKLTAVVARELPLGRRVVVEVMPSAGAPIAGELRSSTGER